MPTNINDDDPDGDDFSAEAVIRRLGRVTAILKKVTERLNTINQRFPNPPPPASVQNIQGALTQAQAAGTECLKICDTIQTKLTPQ